LLKVQYFATVFFCTGRYGLYKNKGGIFGSMIFGVMHIIVLVVSR